MTEPDLDAPTGRFTPLVEGAEHVPAAGAILIAANHVSQLDRVYLARAVGRPVVFPRPWAGPREVIGAALRGASLADPAERWRASAKRALCAGKAVVVFPEGTPSPDGRLYRGDPEVAAMAIETSSRVLPAAIMPRPGRSPIVRFGEPIGLDDWNEALHDPMLLRAAIDTVMSALVDLTGREYVDTDAGVMRLRLDRVRRHESRAARKARAAERARQKAEASERAARYATEEAELIRAELEAASDARDHAVRSAQRDRTHPERQNS